MKQKVARLLAVMTLIAILTGCGRNRLEAPDTVQETACPETTQQTEPVNESTSETMEPLLMDAYGRGSRMEGAHGTADAYVVYYYKLYFGDGYTIYFPRYNGTLEHITNEEGNPAFIDRWTSDTDEIAEEVVAYYAGLSSQDVAQIMMEQEADYALTEYTENNLKGLNPEGTVGVCIYLTEGPEGTYAVTARYKVEKETVPGGGTMGTDLCFNASGLMLNPEGWEGPSQ